MKGLEIAIKQYKIEYLKLPEVTDVSNDSTVIESHGELLAILMADDPAKNDCRIRFWEPPPARDNGAGTRKDIKGNWELRDPWGKNFYRLQMDVDGDGKIANPSTGKRPDGEGDALTSDLIIYSAGPDGDFSTWKDNVTSWR